MRQEREKREQAEKNQKLRKMAQGVIGKISSTHGGEVLAHAATQTQSDQTVWKQKTVWSPFRLMALIVM